MTVYRPLIDDLAHLAGHEGERYIVLRPAGAVPASYEDVRAAVRRQCRGLPVSFPSEPHVTLAGFAKGTPLDAVRELAAEWAARTPALTIEVDGAGTFPTPFQIVVVRIRRTAELLDGLASLRELAQRRSLTQILTVPASDWVFHLTVAYCETLEVTAWANVASFVETLRPSPAKSTVGEAEVVAFDDGREYSGGVVTLASKD